jgi:hypothetical protein
VVRDRWRTLGTATLSRVRFGNYARDELRISFPETRSESYRLVIDNGDSPALAIDGVRAEGNIYAVTFLVTPDSSCRLFYGSASAAKPQYDLATVLGLLRGGPEPVTGDLGDPVENPEFRAAPSWLGRLGSNWFFGIVVTAMVLVLGWGLFRAGRQVGKLPIDE